ncbi:hypothetical protein QFZ60_002977 [Arthrobacter sp. B2I5]|uniref:hypothetical protein n=1 Tax=Arthrobacter sp. B2I5 TaxID=3042266 RepID=UPI0027876EDF|nr:hypothetical protein [Arthrobacter sp. B2I5]MDQ0826804.1 hypothetical protein [Arthrobacter sp. B2I5]
MTLRYAMRGRMVLACSATLLAAGLLSACAGPGSGLKREAAAQLQARVLEVTQASSQNDPATALKALEGLETDLSALQAKGQVSEERRRSITTVATAVRADLKEAVDAQQAAAKAAEDARTGQAAQSPSPTAEVPAPQPAPAPAPAPAQGNAGGNGADAGKNNNGDKGKGKD